MRKADWAVAHHALSDAVPPAIIGLIACGAVLFGTLEAPSSYPTSAPEQSTWPLVPLVAIAMWAGIGIFGEMKVSMAHTLARPLHRGRLLAIRAAVYVATLGAVGLTIRHFSTGVYAYDAGPPLPFVVGLIAAAFGIGILAGASATTETGAVGGSAVGVALAIAPVYLLLDLYTLSWPRIVSSLGVWTWPAALGVAATLVWPVWHVASQLPLRPPRRIVTAVAVTGMLQLLALAAIWQPAASRGTSAEHGELVAIGGGPGGPRISYTGTDSRVDGVFVERDGQRVPVFGDGARRPSVIEAKLSPDGGALALLTLPPEGQGRRVVMLDLETGDRLESEVEKAISLGPWAPDSRELPFIVTRTRARVVVADLSSGTIRELPAAPNLPASKIVGWRPDAVVLLDSAPDQQTLRMVPTHGGGVAHEIPLPSSTPPAVSASSIAWLEVDGQSAAEADIDDEHEWRLAIRPWTPDAAPVVIDLGTWVGAEITGLGFLDEDHTFVELRDSRPTKIVGPDGYITRLFVVHRDGEVKTVVNNRQGQPLSNLSGPLGGPWLATDIHGACGRLRVDGMVVHEQRGKNLGNRKSAWIPMRETASGVEFIDRFGRSVSVSVSGEKEESR